MKRSSWCSLSLGLSLFGAVLGSSCGSSGSKVENPDPMPGLGGSAGEVDGGGGVSGSGMGGSGGETAAPTVRWDYTGIIGTGQSLAVGAEASNITPKATTSSNNNLKLSLGTAVMPPFNADDAALSLVPLTEPIRPLATGFPSAYPANLYGESPHTAMGAQITALQTALVL